MLHLIIITSDLMKHYSDRTRLDDNMKELMNMLHNHDKIRSYAVLQQLIQIWTIKGKSSGRKKELEIKLFCISCQLEGVGCTAAE